MTCERATGDARRRAHQGERLLQSQNFAFVEPDAPAIVASRDVDLLTGGPTHAIAHDSSIAGVNGWGFIGGILPSGRVAFINRN